MNNLWILTEERPKNEVIQTILSKIASDKSFIIEFEEIHIIPIIEAGHFTFTYKVVNVKSDGFTDVFIKIVSGDSSFVDFLLFLQKNEPTQNDIPLYAIEETKTDDSESRNTGVYQRCSKFVYVDFYYPNINKIMLYNLRIPQKKKLTLTNIFGTKMLRTINVEIIGKVFDKKVRTPFKSLKELVETKNAMRMPPKGNVPIRIKVYSDRITISGRLYKSGRIGHDPNIGALTIISSCIRIWEKIKDIVIVEHGLKKEDLGKNNKFIQIANRLRIKLAGLKIPTPVYHDAYWHYDNTQEKIGTIFVSILCEEYGDGVAIYENHGGCERGYFIDINEKNTNYIVIPKYVNRKKYKAGNKSYIINIPDLVIYDKKRNLAIDGEGKTSAHKKQGLRELKSLTYFEKNYIQKYYPKLKIIRTLILYGGTSKKVSGKDMGLLLNSSGEVILGKNSPEIFKESLKKLLSS